MISSFDNIKNYFVDISENYKLLYANIRNLYHDNIDLPIIRQCEEYLAKEKLRFDSLRESHREFSTQLNALCEKYLNNVTGFEEQQKKEIEEVKAFINDARNKLEAQSDGIDEITLSGKEVTSLVYRDNKASKITVDLLKNYPGSYLYKEYMSDRRTTEGSVYIDQSGENDELIIKYMKNDQTLLDDIKEMTYEQKKKFLGDLSSLELPLKKKIIECIGCNEDNEIMEAWRNRRVVMVDGKNSTELNSLLKQHNLFDNVFENETVKNIQYYKQNNTIYVNKNMAIYQIIEDYLKNDKKINEDMITQYIDKVYYQTLIGEMEKIGIIVDADLKRSIKGCFYESHFINMSHIIDNQEYDICLQKWIGERRKMKLIYRASEHNYTAESFHKCCDNIEDPVLVIIKTSEGWIFGGYTSSGWNYDSILILIIY